MLGGAGLLYGADRLQRGLLDRRAQAGADERLEAYRGILANPDLGVAGAGNLAGLLGSTDPSAVQQGQQLIQDYYAQRALGSRPITPAEQARLEQSQAQFDEQMRQQQQLAAINQRRLAAQAQVKQQGQLAEQQIDNMSALRGQYLQNPAIRDARDAQVNYQQMVDNLAAGNPLAAQVSVVNLARIIDPGSVVRGEEVARYEGKNSFLLNLQVKADRLRGEGFPAEIRAQMRAVARSGVGNRLAGAQQIRSQFAAIAQANGWPAEQITVGDAIDWRQADEVIRELNAPVPPPRELPPDAVPVEQRPAPGILSRMITPGGR